MAWWAELLCNILPHRSDACLWLLNELGRCPTILKELVLSPEETVRHAATCIAAAALRQCMLTTSDAGNDDVYLAAYTAAAEEQDRQEAEMFLGGGGQGGESLAQGFVAVGQADVASEAQDDDTLLVQKTVRGLCFIYGVETSIQVLAMWGGCLEYFEIWVLLPICEGRREFL